MGGFTSELPRASQDANKERGFLFDGINDQQDMTSTPNKSGAGGGGAPSELPTNVQDAHGRLPNSCRSKPCCC